MSQLRNSQLSPLSFPSLLTASLSSLSSLAVPSLLSTVALPTVSLLTLLFCLTAYSQTKAEPTSESKLESKTITKKVKDKSVSTTKGNTTVVIETSKGTIEAELWSEKAPVTVANFLAYADEKYYDNTIFHRVIKNFMIQGGGFTQDMKEKTTHAAIKNEATPELKNVKGTLAMARTSDINSATSQFFINLVDNDFLNQKGKAPQNFGYAAFGHVTKGMEFVEAIGNVATKTTGHHQDVPAEPVLIKSIRKK